MPFPIALVLPALIPVFADGLRAIFTRLTDGAGVRPANTAEAIQLMQADAARLQALAALDAPGGSISSWVADLRASARYIAAGVCILGGWALAAMASAYPEQVPSEVAARGMDAADSAFSFLFGDRMYAHLRRK